MAVFHQFLLNLSLVTSKVKSSVPWHLLSKVATTQLPWDISSLLRFDLFQEQTNKQMEIIHK